MFRKTLTLAAILAPSSAFAHSEGHEALSMSAEVAHIMLDPLHLGLVAMIVMGAGLVWKSLRATTARQTQN